MSGLIVPETGWLAAKMMPFGNRMALALLGVVNTLEGGQASDDDLATWYATLADSDDSVFDLNQHYIEAEAKFPFLAGILSPLTGWTEEPSFDAYDKVRRGADILKTVSWSETEPRAGGDILGRVYNQMLSIGARRTTVFDYSSIADAYLGLVERGAFLLKHRSFTDAWCGSGCRVIAFHQLLMDTEHSTDIPFRLNDPNPVAAAIAGLNMVCYGIGPDVKIATDRAWAEIWAANSLWAMSPQVRASMPPELSLDAPLPAAALGQEVLPGGESPFHLLG